MTLLGAKSAVKSIGVWGGLIAIVPAIDQILSVFGVLPAGTLNGASEAVIAAIGGVLAVFGRVRASQIVSRIF